MAVNLHPVFLAAVALIVAKWLAELWLDTINRRRVLAHAGKVPPAFENIIDAPTYDKSVRYTLAKNSLSHIETAYDTIILLLIIGGGILPLALRRWTDAVGNSAWAMAGFLFALGVVLSLIGLPLAWHSQFRLEERFGFNTTTPNVWWMDRLKGLLLALALGYPLLVLILKLIEWTGSLWWFWAWVCVMAFQLLMVVLAPVLI